MALTPTPTVAEATLTGVLINGGLVTSTVDPGSTIQVSLAYADAHLGCLGCIEQIQFGFSDQDPIGCFFDQSQGDLIAGSVSFTVTAPSTPGTYFLAFERAQDFGCFVSSTSWWNGTPVAANYFAMITVH